MLRAPRPAASFLSPGIPRVFRRVRPRSSSLSPDFFCSPCRLFSFLLVLLLMALQYLLLDQELLLLLYLLLLEQLLLVLLL